MLIENKHWTDVELSNRVVCAFTLEVSHDDPISVQTHFRMFSMTLLTGDAPHHHERGDALRYGLHSCTFWLNLSNFDRIYQLIQ